MRENQQAIELLDDWFSESDDLGEEFWAEYEQEIEQNPFTVRR